MFDFTTLGKGLLVTGLGLAAIGAALWLLGRSGLPLGRLPGDIQIDRPGFSFRLPLATSILLSVLLTVGINILLRIFRK